MVLLQVDTTCFHCGVALKDWQEMDCCWKEHGKLNPRFIFVIFIKGIQFLLDNVKALSVYSECVVRAK